jgi:protein gp37
MAETTKIEWAHSTFNPWTGCTKVSPGCANCYAEAWSKRSGIVRWGPGQPRRRTSAKLWADVERWNAAAAASGEQHRVFSASLADWLDHEVPVEWLRDLLALVGRTHALTWMLLTKRPELWRERLTAVAELGLPGDPAFARAICGWLEGQTPKNVWIGTTVEDQQRADERIPALLAIPARVRFLSCEPLLGPVDLRRWLEPEFGTCPSCDAGLPTACTCPRDIHWIIAGGESGAGARPMHPAWANEIREQAEHADVAFLFKQWGEWAPDTLDRALAGLTGNRQPTPVPGPDGQVLGMVRFGKKAAGRELGGRTWDEVPT